MQSCRISVFVATLLMLGAGACTTEGDPDPGINAIGQDYYGNAGCLVKHDRQMLVVRLRSTGRLDNPGGTHESGETARSTARRETWEEAGLEVEVGDLLIEMPDMNYFLFECMPAEEFATPASRVLYTRMGSEISEVMWVDPASIEPADWRFPGELDGIRQAFADL